MSHRVLDVSHLPTTGFGPRMTLWWGMMVFLAIEGTVLAMLAVTYLYLWVLAPAWPPNGTPPPSLPAGTLNTALLAASAVLAWLTDRAARDNVRRRTLALMVGMIAVGLLSLTLRAFELGGLHCRWDTHAYGSIVWLILGMHGTHVLAETGENVLLALVLCCGRLERKHYGDVHVNMVYWYFVVGAWLALYALVYWLPRL